VDPLTIQFLAEKGIDASHHRAKALDEIPNRGQIQIVVALDDEGQSAMPRRPSKAVGIDWSVPDPASRRGTPPEARRAYEQAFESLQSHITDLVQAVLDAPSHDPISS
jgi:protein-tyrosine-phosphatase